MRRSKARVWLADYSVSAKAQGLGGVAGCLALGWACRGRDTCGVGQIVVMLWAWSGAGAGPEAVPTRPPAEARKGPFALPSPPGPHGGRSCGPRTRREPSSGEEAAPVTAMAAESALQVVEKLQARLAANPEPKKVSCRRVSGTGGRWARRGPCNGRGPGEVGFFQTRTQAPRSGAEQRGVRSRWAPPGWVLRTGEAAAPFGSPRGSGSRASCFPVPAERLCPLVGGPEVLWLIGSRTPVLSPAP